MRIEIDTKNDTKEELAHLANMLRAIAGSSSSSLQSSSVMDSRIERKLARKGLMESQPSEPSASGGLFNLFNDDAEPAPSAPAETSSSAASGDLFSLFSSDPPAQPSQPASPSPEFQPAAAPSAFDILSQASSDDEPAEAKEEGTTSVKDILEDDRIVPY